MGKTYWTAAQTFSTAEARVRRDVEKAEIGAFVPTFVRCSIRRGRKVDRELALLPGYVFVHLSAEQCGIVPEIDGVCRVLPGRVDPGEMMRLMVGHVARDYDEAVVLPSAPSAPSRSRRKRRPRPRRSKAVRNPTHA